MLVDTRTAQVETHDGTVPVYEAIPTGGTALRGGLVVVQEAFGVTDHIEDVTRRAAEAGWHAVAPHLFWRTGDPRLGYEDFAATRPHTSQLRHDHIVADVDAALGVLSAAGLAALHVGVVGFCAGGLISLVIGVERPVSAAVTFYGGGITEGRFGFAPLATLAPRLRAPWLGLYGDQDSGIPTVEVEALRRAAARADVPTEIVRYPDAGHGFHCDARASYAPDAAADAWSRTLAWLDTHVPPAP